MKRIRKNQNEIIKEILDQTPENVTLTVRWNKKTEKFTLTTDPKDVPAVAIIYILDTMGKRARQFVGMKSDKPEQKVTYVA